MKIEPLLSIYNDAYWEKTAVFYESGGFLVTSRLRILRGQLNREEKAKFDKERHMCLRYASYGFQIEHLAEFPGKSTPDVNVVRHPAVQGIVVVNGKRAELKSLKGFMGIITLKMSTGTNLFKIRHPSGEGGVEFCQSRPKRNTNFIAKIRIKFRIAIICQLTCDARDLPAGSRAGRSRGSPSGRRFFPRRAGAPSFPGPGRRRKACPRIWTS